MKDQKELSIKVDGKVFEINDENLTLLDFLRSEVGITSVKDGCSPQGQCGCCTVLVDGQARVSCVTPVRRVAGREITTLQGLDNEIRNEWAEAFSQVGASQCGFCTPGIIMRFAALREGREQVEIEKVKRSLHAHLCRCTGWQTIVEAWEKVGKSEKIIETKEASLRASIEGRSTQKIGLDIALGKGGFSADTAPSNCLIAVPDSSGGWSLGENLSEARNSAQKIQGRRTTVKAVPPIELPPGDWDAVLKTNWVEPGYLETDSAWCEPGGEPSTPLANGGAFGSKLESPVPEVARSLANKYKRPVLAILSREDSVRLGPKRPPIAGGVNKNGQGVIRVARTPGITDAIHSVAPEVNVEEVDLQGPITSSKIRAAGWAEAQILLCGAAGQVGSVISPDGSSASAQVDERRINISLRCGEPLDEAVLRSYCIGAAHMAWSWVTSESLTVDENGEVQDLTIRSFGIVRAGEMPEVHVDIEPDEGKSVNGSDAVFAAVAAATWIHKGTLPEWPTG
ncbi:MAG: 2Fe-2S iron-sulfur cluster-binding protein [Acidimicrobiales bacterium]|nr:2Fe-2S iron-sulfur cluster-binding protein [Acidimicrobiales bacterium]HJM38460.1 2Fe-2S iron-sulfur cluster-binding protein [Acidimicrobiales bacterium]|tara:strand:+ start:842 stop:2374 length:1533 start_codon:yes stop_codon:yes gene_type:complete